MITDAPSKDLVVEKGSGAGLVETTPPPAPVRPAAFERLHALVRKGYIANIGAETGTEVIVLKHLGKSPDLVLHPDGLVEEYEGRRPWHKRHIEAPMPIPADSDADQLRFMKFLDTVPRATFRDRTRKWRHTFIYFPAVLLVILGICLAITVTMLGG